MGSGKNSVGASMTSASTEKARLRGIGLQSQGKKDREEESGGSWPASLAEGMDDGGSVKDSASENRLKCD